MALWCRASIARSWRRRRRKWGSARRRARSTAASAKLAIGALCSPAAHVPPELCHAGTTRCPGVNPHPYPTACLLYRLLVLLRRGDGTDTPWLACALECDGQSHIHVHAYQHAGWPSQGRIDVEPHMWDWAAACRSSLIPSPLEPQAQLSATGSAFSDTDSDGETLARLRASPAPLTGAVTCPQPFRCGVSPVASATPSSVPAPPRLGRVSGSAACAARSAQAHAFAGATETPLLSEAPSPSSDHSEAGFATCRGPPFPEAAAALH